MESSTEEVIMNTTTISPEKAATAHYKAPDWFTTTSSTRSSPA